MNRRAFVAGGVVLLAAPRGGEAQQAAKVARIGYLGTGSLESPEIQANLDAFRQGLIDLGYVEGSGIHIEYRTADGKLEQLAALATELVRLKVDIIVAGATPAARAAQQATTTIPVVAVAMGDPVRDGLVASLARPGANITGRSEEHTSELQSPCNLVCRLLLEKKKKEIDKDPRSHIRHVLS